MWKAGLRGSLAFVLSSSASSAGIALHSSVAQGQAGNKDRTGVVAADCTTWSKMAGLLGHVPVKRQGPGMAWVSVFHNVDIRI
jgi:hypothetical protein